MEETSQRDSSTNWRVHINWNTFVAVFFIAFSVVFFFLIPSEIAEPKLAVARAMESFKPSLFPEIALIGLFGVSVWYLIVSVRMKETHLFGGFTALQLLRIVAAVAIFVAYALLFPILGYLISTALMALAMTLYLGTRKILILLLVVIVIPVAIYFVFTQLLMVSLPTIPFLNGSRYF